MDIEKPGLIHHQMKPFGVAGWEVDPASLRICKESQVRKLEPKAMSLLCYLANQPGVVISRQQLESSVWSGTVVGYDALSNAIIKLRKAFDDKARDPRIIETIAKSGYRLIARVELFDEELKLKPTEIPREEEAEEVRVLPELPTKPSIAVLPFDNMSGDKEQEYFADGISEDITTDLAKLSGLLVIARNSAFAYKGTKKNLVNIGRELGVGFILEGSVRKAGERIRVNAQLIDCRSGGHIWAERYDHDLTDLFSVQDDVTRAIICALAPTLTGSEQRTVAPRESQNMEAYDYFLMGREQSLLDTEQSNELACSLLDKSIEIDPLLSSAYAYLGRCYGVAFINNWGDPSKQSLQKGLVLAQKGVSLNKDNPMAHFSVGVTAFWLRDNQLALQEIKTSLKIMPNFAEGFGALSMIQIFSGKPEKALESLQTTMRLDPHYRDIYLHFLGQANFHLGRYSEAVVALKRRLVRKPDSDISRVLLAASYGHLGKLKNGRGEFEEALSINPGFSLEQKRCILPYQNPADFEHIVEGLHKAGIVVLEPNHSG